MPFSVDKDNAHVNNMTQLCILIRQGINTHSLAHSMLVYYDQVAEKILNGKELEFYKWEGELSQLLQNVRDKLNRVAEV